MNKEGEYKLPPAVANYTGIEYRGTTRSVLSSDSPVITVVDPSKVTPAPTGTQGTGSSTHPASTSDPSVTNNPEPTPTPITPGFDIFLAVIMLVFAAAFRRR
jgi:hypothetical protein